MKNILFIALLTCFTTVVNAEKTSQASDIELITQPLNSYLTGHIKGDKNLLGKALHSEGKLSYLREGEYRKIEFPDYLSRMKLRKPNDGVTRIPYIKSIDVSGNMAVARLVLDYSTMLFTDYMTLLKINGEWKITNKIAYSVRDPKNNKAISANIAEVLAPISLFVKAYQTGKTTHLQNIFHKEAKTMSVLKSEYVAVTNKTFLSQFSQQSALQEKLLKHKIQSVDTTGNVAVAKVTFYYPSATNSHYISLLNIDGTWKIVNNAFDITFNKVKTLK